MTTVRFYLRGASLLLLLVFLLAPYCHGNVKDSIKSGLATGTTVVKTISSLGDPKVSKVFNALGKMAGFLGAVGGFVSFILAFLPSQESAELKYMKKQFTLVNTKLDKITSELDNIKNIIKYENQRSAYVSSSHAILFGFKQLSKFFDELQRTKCHKSTCKRVRARIASRYIKSFNVKFHLYKILHGTFRHSSVFGDPLLSVVSKTFQCDFSKIDEFANGVLKLAFKGQQVVLAHEKLVGNKHSITQSMNDWLKNIYSLRSKTYSIKSHCYKGIKSYILKDIRNSDYQIRASTNEIANRMVKTFLEKKYPWISVVAFSYGGHGSREHCNTDVYGGLWSMPRDKNARKRNLVVGIVDKHGTYGRQKHLVSNALDDISKHVKFFPNLWDCCTLLRLLRKEMKKKDVWKYVATLNVRKMESGLKFLADDDRKYISAVYTFYQRKRRGQSFRVKRHILIVLKSTEQANRRGCSLTCQNGGQCKVYPYSTSQYCQCKPFYQGDLCQEHTKAELAKTVDAMLAITLTLPVLSDVAFDIKNLREFVGIGFTKMQKSISKLESSMQRKFDQISKNINDKFKWANFITMYKDAIQTIEYYNHRFERLPIENTDQHLLEKRGKELAIAALHPHTGIRKALFQLHNLLVGKVDKPLLNHQSILFAFMKSRSRAGEPCTASYKRAVDNYWRQLLLLQQLGYMVWAQALGFTGRKSNIVSTLYSERIRKQVSAIKKGTCKYDIRNSINVHCNKHYLLPSMAITNRCKRNYYVRGSMQTSCRKKRSVCAACRCYRPGSISRHCTNIHGRCSCRRGFYGVLCRKRDCVWHNWSRYGHCLNCGYGARKLRRRKIKVTHVGRGKRCFGPSVSYASCFKGCCRNQFHCSNRRKCIQLSQRCDYDNNCGDKQDERHCNERCYTRYTSLSTYGGGRVVYLDRHHPICHKGEAMKMFHLQRIGGSIRYQYTCCRLLKSYICRNRRTYNHFTYAKHNTKSYYLRHQKVSCGSASFLSSFHLNRNSRHDRIRYEYNCCRLRYSTHRRKTRCYSQYTGWTLDGHGKNYYLDRQTVKCAHRYFLNTFQLHWKGRSWWRMGHWRYYYRCCKINV